MNVRPALVALVAGLLSGRLMACDGLQAESAWVRLPPPGNGHAGGYVTLRNTGEEKIQIVGVASPDFKTAHMHATLYRDGQARMRSVDVIELAPGDAFEATPGGHHLMLGGPLRALAADTRVTIVFECAGGGSVELSVPVRRRAPD